MARKRLWWLIPLPAGGRFRSKRCGLDAMTFASDLNPVACLILKVMLEDIPRHGPKLAEEIRRVGAEIKQQAEKELADFYPRDPDGATPIAYLWARTITCEGPGCGAEIPLLRSLWLAKKGTDSVALRVIPRPSAKRIDFEIVGNAKLREVGEGTVRRSSATCQVCVYTTSAENVRNQSFPRSVISAMA